MIITAQKPLDEILDSIRDYTSILVAGCDGCTQPPRGLREANSLCQLIELGGRLRGKDFHCKATTVAKQCDNHLVATTFNPLIEGVDAIVSLSCGIGVQTLTEVLPDLPTLSAQNTLFLGAEEREEGNIQERCAACGDCILDETGGICPIARCAKGLLNGPCGGTNNGKCEVDPEKDCAWTLIYQRLEKLGRLDLMRKYRPPRNFHVVVRPGKITTRLVTTEEVA